MDQLLPSVAPLTTKNTVDKTFLEKNPTCKMKEKKIKKEVFIHNLTCINENLFLSLLLLQSYCNCC